MSTKTIVVSTLLLWITVSGPAVADAERDMSVQSTDVFAFLSGGGLHIFAHNKSKKLEHLGEKLIWDTAQKEMDEVYKHFRVEFLNSASAEWLRVNRTQIYQNIMMSDLPVSDRELRLAREALLIGNHLGLSELEMKDFRKSLNALSKRRVPLVVLKWASPFVTLSHFYKRYSEMKEAAWELDNGTGHLAPLAPRSFSAE